MTNANYELFFKGLRAALYLAKNRRSWARQALRDAERDVRSASRELKKFGGSPRKPRKRAKK
jgi:hypothetical protein